MKVAVSSYSFNNLTKQGMTQKDCIGKARQLGFDAIEFVGIQAPSGISEEAYAKELAEECAREGMPISCFTFGADFLTGSGGDTAAEIQRVKGYIDIAAILGATQVRHDATTGDGRPFDAVLPVIADACRQVTEYAKTKGIKTTIENHGFFCQDSERIEKIYTMVNDPNFGILIDMGNFLCADEAPERAVGRLAPYAFYAHAKDFIVKKAGGGNPGEGFFRSRGGNYLRGTIVGHGDVPVAACVNALETANYDGYISIEFEGMEDTLQALSIGLSNLRRFISAANA